MRGIALGCGLFAVELHAIVPGCLRGRSQAGAMSAADANIVFAWERSPGRGISPELGRCERRIEQCPGLREIWLFERRIALILAQRPALGGIRLFARARPPAFSQVGAPPFSAPLPSRDLAPRFFSRAGTLCLEKLDSLPKSASFSQAATLCPERRGSLPKVRRLPALSCRASQCCR